MQNVPRFVGLVGDPAALAIEVSLPPSLGRWRAHDPAVVAELERVGERGCASWGTPSTAGRPTTRVRLVA